jgi:hypothetical protein
VKCENVTNVVVEYDKKLLPLVLESYELLMVRLKNFKTLALL